MGVQSKLSTRGFAVGALVCVRVAPGGKSDDVISMSSQTSMPSTAVMLNCSDSPSSTHSASVSDTREVVILGALFSKHSAEFVLQFVVPSSRQSTSSPHW